MIAIKRQECSKLATIGTYNPWTFQHLDIFDNDSTDICFWTLCWFYICFAQNKVDNLDFSSRFVGKIPVQILNVHYINAIQIIKVLAFEYHFNYTIVKTYFAFSRILKILKKNNIFDITRDLTLETYSKYFSSYLTSLTGMHAIVKTWRFVSTDTTEYIQFLCILLLTLEEHNFSYLKCLSKILILLKNLISDISNCYFCLVLIIRREFTFASWYGLDLYSFNLLRESVCDLIGRGSNTSSKMVEETSVQYSVAIPRCVGEGVKGEELE